MESLRQYLNSLPPREQKAFAKRCKTSVGYLRKAISIKQRISVDLAIAVQRESDGVVNCEDLRPDVDWEYLRNSAPDGAVRPQQTA